MSTIISDIQQDGVRVLVEKEMYGDDDRPSYFVHVQTSSRAFVHVIIDNDDEVFAG